MIKLNHIGGSTWVAPLLRWGILSLGFLLSGCVLAPAGTEREQQRLHGAGEPFEPPIESRNLPELPSQATWHDVLHRAFLANGDLEAAYFEWKAALQRIPQVANYPNTNIAPTFSYMFSAERMKAFDRTTVNIGFDPMENLSFPTKVAQAGRVALEEARAAGERFAAAKFELQRKVLIDYLNVALHAEEIRIQTENTSLLKFLADTASDRVEAGAPQQDLLKAQTEYRLAENELTKKHAEHRAMLAMLNGMMDRDPQASLELPSGIPAPRQVAVDDARLIAVAVDQNPGLAALARQVSGRREALELAKQGFIPDINPFAAFTGGMSQVVGAMVVLPTTIPEIQGKIDETRAMLRASEAMLRQAKSDRAASFVAALYLMRNSERQAEIFQQTILPRAEQAMASSRQAYATGTGRFIDLIDTQRTLLQARLMLAEVRVEREKRLAELEALAGVDIETLAPPTSAPATQPHDLPNGSEK